MELHNLTNAVKNNAIGAVVGGVAGFYVAKKRFNVTHKWHLALATAVGVAVGVFAQGKIAAKSSVPTAGTINAGTTTVTAPIVTK